MILLLLLLCIACAPVSAEPLKAVITHSEQLPALPKTLIPGRDFDKSVFNQAISDRWVQIPEWLAGEFQTSQSVLVSETDMRSGVKTKLNRIDTPKTSTIFIGCQRDANGNYWDLLQQGTRSKIELRDRTQYNVNQDSQQSLNDDGSVYTLQRGPAILVNPANNRIMKANWIESVSKTIPVTDGTMCTTSTIEFTATGEPSIRLMRKTHRIRTGPYKEAPETRESFERFCQENKIPLVAR